MQKVHSVKKGTNIRFDIFNEYVNICKWLINVNEILWTRVLRLPKLGYVLVGKV